MASTTSFLTPDLIQKAVNEGAAQAASMLQTIWPQVRLYFIGAALLIVLIKLIAGRIGSAIYNFIYFGVLFLIITIFGIEILLNPFFDVIYALLYPVSFLLTGKVLGRG